jgi:hypothetical protein
MSEQPAPYRPNPALKRVETGFESLIFNSRWLMAPFYFGLVVSLAVLLLKFCMVLWEFILHAPGSKESDIILGVLRPDRHFAYRQSDPDRGVFGLREFRLEDRSRRPSGLAGLDDQGQFRRPEAKTTCLDRGDLAIQVLKAFMNLDAVFDPSKLGLAGRRASGVRGLGVHAGGCPTAGAAAIREVSSVFAIRPLPLRHCGNSLVA